MHKGVIEIRPARIDDADGIATLMVQLGYDVPVAEIAQRLRRRQDRRAVFVAVRDQSVVGWAAVCTDEPLVEGFGAHLEGLVVGAEWRSRGIGAQLIEVVERWARARGCDDIRVQSNVVRKRAHRFYGRQGYATIKSQYQLHKRL